ncbi:MAG TPA: AraC family transcriptional regulator [Saprospiraceae bacterium]|nr:AraC family transcriptional regulator [Saprospiraceae bacterium]
MILNLKIDGNKMFKMMLERQLEKAGLEYHLNDNYELFIKQELNQEELDQLNILLANYGIEVRVDQKDLMVIQIKEAILEMLQLDDFNTIKISKYLSKKLNNRYNELAVVFSEHSFCTIESFIIIQKVEMVKEFLLNEKISLSEIAYRLNYSSISHLSAQFKKITGLSPTIFKRVIERRREMDYV